MATDWQIEAAAKALGDHLIETGTVDWEAWPLTTWAAVMLKGIERARCQRPDVSGGVDLDECI